MSGLSRKGSQTGAVKCDLRFFTRQCSRLRSEREQALITLRRERAAFKRERRAKADALKAQALVQEVAADVQQQVHSRIAALVTRCLAAVYQDPYTFEIRFEKKRGKTDARMVFVRRGKERDPMDGVGGGVLDLAAFALKLACLVIRKPARRRVMVCDEPFKHLDAVRKERVRELLERLSADLDVQFIITTHADELTVGKVVRVR